MHPLTTQDRHRAREVRVPAREPPPDGVRRARQQAPQRARRQVRLGTDNGIRQHHRLQTERPERHARARRPVRTLRRATR